MLALLCLVFSARASEHHDSAGEAQDLTTLSLEELLHEEITPINVLGSHTHPKGGFMVGYRYGLTELDHNLDGTHEVSPQEVLQRYPVAHTSMTMEMHEVELMYAPLDKLTLMAMIPYEEMSMDHLLRSGGTRTDHSSGLGDVSFMALVNLLGNPQGSGHRLLLNAGFSAPTGSIDEGENGTRFEYPMQLGSGTYDMLPGLTYLGESQLFAWGAQVMGTVRLGSNEHQYRLGHAYRLSEWGQMKVTEWFGPSLRLDWQGWGNVAGADPELNPLRNPAFDAKKQSGERLDLMAGLNFYVPKGPLKGNRLSIEGGVPLYQSIAGPNLGVDWMLTVGWSFSFH